MNSDFTYLILPEDKAPAEANEYKQCEVYKQNPRIVWGEGNPKAPIVIILDNPGAREDKDGKEYVCGTRQTLQEAIYEADLDIKDIYITYLLKWFNLEFCEVCVKFSLAPFSSRKSIAIIIKKNILNFTIYQSCQA